MTLASHSWRHGYQPSDREIIIREEAPEEFRANVSI